MRWRHLLVLLAAGALSCDGGRQVLGWEVGGGDSMLPGDEPEPWPGGHAYYGPWSRSPWRSPDSFPIWVWMQNPDNAERFKAVGIPFIHGLWQGPTAEQLARLRTAGVHAACDQAGAWQDHLDDPSIGGWLAPDSPDGAQLNAGGEYEPCVAVAKVEEVYRRMSAADPTRPILLHLSRGVAETDWVGRGDCTGRTDMYPGYSAGGDVLGFYLYPLASGLPIELIATGVDNLRRWSGYKKPVMPLIQASVVDGITRPTPVQLAAQVWSALVHGAGGIGYYCHQDTPSNLIETDCLDDAPTAAALTAINGRILALARVLNAPPVANGVTVASSSPVDVSLRRWGGATYLFAVNMRDTDASATFTLRAFPATANAEVLDEARTLTVASGVFSDTFVARAVHLYRITY